MRQPTQEEIKKHTQKMIEKKGLPKSLYKFKCWMCEDDKLILTDPAVWFASPATFNDPFDCRIPYRGDLMSDEDKFEWTRDILQRKNPDWGDEKLHEEAKLEVCDNSAFSEDRYARQVFSR